MVVVRYEHHELKLSIRSLRIDLGIDGQTEIRRKRDDFLGLSHKDPLSFAQTIIDIPATNDRQFSELVSCTGCWGEKSKQNTKRPFGFIQK